VVAAFSGGRFDSRLQAASTRVLFGCLSEFDQRIRSYISFLLQPLFPWVKVQSTFVWERFGSPEPVAGQPRLKSMEFPFSILDIHSFLLLIRPAASQARDPTAAEHPKSFLTPLIALPSL